MKINREEFVGVLDSVMSGLSPKETVEQSSCFAFTGGNVISYNDEVYCRAPSLLDKKVKGAVKGAPLITVLKKLNEEMVDVTVTDKEMVISGRRRKISMYLEEKMLVQEIGEPDKWSKLPDEFAEAVGMVCECAGEDESRIDLTCVHICPEWVEACDSYHMCRWTLKTGFKSPVLLRESSMKGIVPLGMTEVGASPNWVQFRNPDGIVIGCRKYDNDYPDLSPMIEIKGGKTISLSSSMTKSVDIAREFTKELSNTEQNLVNVDIRAGKIRIGGLGLSGRYEGWNKLEGYDGPPMTWMIPPDVMQSLIEKHPKFRVTKNRLFVRNPRYTYVSSIGVSEKESNGEASE